MIAPVLRIFFVDPAFSASAKEEVHTLLAAACSATAFVKPVAAVLSLLLKLAESPVVATPQDFESTLTDLQECTPLATGDSASLLHRLIAMLEYFKFHQQLTSPKMAKNICTALFPTSLSRSTSIEELITPALKGLPLEIFLSYGGLLMDCLLQANATKSCLIEISTKLLGSAAFLERNEVNRHLRLLKSAMCVHNILVSLWYL